MQSPSPASQESLKTLCCIRLRVEGLELRVEGLKSIRKLRVESLRYSQYAPDPFRIAGIVFNKIFMSKRSDQLSMYSKSICTQ